MAKIRIDTNIPDTYSTKDAAELLGISYATLFRKIKAGEIQVIKLAGRTLITKSEIERQANRESETTEITVNLNRE